MEQRATEGTTTTTEQGGRPPSDARPRKAASP